VEIFFKKADNTPQLIPTSSNVIFLFIMTRFVLLDVQPEMTPAKAKNDSDLLDF
jgi:hypothetical protein